MENPWETVGKPWKTQGKSTENLGDKYDKVVQKMRLNKVKWKKIRKPVKNISTGV